MHVDDRSGVPTAHIEPGTLRPGQSVRAEVDLALLPSAPGDYALAVTVLSSDLVRPLSRRHAFSVVGSLDAEVPGDRLGEFFCRLPEALQKML